jgi:orotidine-5'-phosphate decarboxylase
MTDLILALDVTGRDDALRIAGQCAPFIDAVKLGYPIILAQGLSFAGGSAGSVFPSSQHFKVADIPSTNLDRRTGLCHGFSAVIAMVSAEATPVAACVDAAHENKGESAMLLLNGHRRGRILPRRNREDRRLAGQWC